LEKHSWITVFGADARNGSSRDKVVAPPWVPGRRMTEVGVPDRAQSLGQHVTQIALHEFGARQGEFASAVVVRAVLPAEGDQEIRGVHPFGRFTLDPPSGCLATALRAGRSVLAEPLNPPSLNRLSAHRDGFALPSE
jgi:hypothetical protein